MQPWPECGKAAGIGAEALGWSAGGAFLTAGLGTESDGEKGHGACGILGIGTAHILARHRGGKAGGITISIGDFRGTCQVENANLFFPREGDGIGTGIDRLELAVKGNLFDLGFSRSLAKNRRGVGDQEPDQGEEN